MMKFFACSMPTDEGANDLVQHGAGQLPHGIGTVVRPGYQPCQSVRAGLLHLIQRCHDHLVAGSLAAESLLLQLLHRGIVLLLGLRLEFQVALVL